MSMTICYPRLRDKRRIRVSVRGNELLGSGRSVVEAKEFSYIRIYIYIYIRSTLIVDLTCRTSDCF
jgi:hypothetical protein